MLAAILLSLTSRINVGIVAVALACSPSTIGPGTIAACALIAPLRGRQWFTLAVLAIWITSVVVFRVNPGLSAIAGRPS